MPRTKKGRSNGTRDVPLSNGRELRRFAEWAEGGQDLDLVVVEDAAHHLQLKKTIDVTTTDRQLLRLQTGPGAHPDVKVTLKTDHFGPAEIHERNDAAFWSVAAYEKFVMPYYTALRTLPHEEWEALDKIIHDERTAAIIHTFPSKFDPIEDPPTFRTIDTSGQVRMLSEVIEDRVAQNRAARKGSD